jgi:hypothetical protein
MKTLLVIAIAMSCFSFCPINEKEEPNGRPGFYVLVEDYSARTYQKYLVESKDSVDKIFNNCFNSELRLGEIDSPISIYNVRHNFMWRVSPFLIHPEVRKNSKT